MKNEGKPKEKFKEEKDYILNILFLIANFNQKLKFVFNNSPFYRKM